MKTDARHIAWSRRYGAALRRYLRPGKGPVGPLQATPGLGRQAVGLGLETLDVARMHSTALAKIVGSGGSSRAGQELIRRANEFFTETIVPIEKNHSAALSAGVRVVQLAETLRRRTVESTASAELLRRGIDRRREAESALKKSEQHRAGLLQVSRRLQRRLRVQTRAILSAQERGRLTSSHLLQDEVTQTLMAIKLRLLILKRSAKVNMASLKKEIAETQRLVKVSAETIQRLAHGRGVSYER